MKKKTIDGSSKRQPGYRYELSEPMGKNFDPEFTPDLDPQEMLKLGVFGGWYFLDGVPDEFPKTWFDTAKLSPSKNKESQYNFFKVHASQPLEIWQQKGWIHPDDPYGWFQWYCRYYLGRRNKEEDARQIKRWKAFRRHAVQVTKNCNFDDWSCRPKQRQALLHWAYDSRKL